MPYDQFVRWQLAGDEIAPQNPLAMMATGFLGAGVFPTQITANEVERTRYDALDDMAATMGNAMLGLTIGCARCHDHKFDPIPQADYYRLLATFTTTVRSNLDVNLEPKEYAAAKEAFDREHQPLVESLVKFEREELPARLAAWEQTAEAAEVQRSPWIVLELGNLKSNGGATLARQDDGSVLVSGANPDSDWFALSGKTHVKNIRAIRIEALADPSLPVNGPGRGANGNFVLTDLKLRGKEPGKEAGASLTLQNARATAERASFAAAAAIDGNETTGWSAGKEGTEQAAVFELAEPLANGEGTTLAFQLHFKKGKQQALGRLRISVSGELDAPLAAGSGVREGVLRTLAKAADERLAAEQRGLAAWYRHRDEAWQKVEEVVARHAREAPQPKVVKIMVCSEGVTPIRHHTQGADFFNETYFLKRGDCDQKMGVAEQGFLQVLMRSPERERRWQTQPPEGAKTSFRRTALARWITDTEAGAGHLLARVIVNRLWQHHFGQGLVATPNDFGVQGTRPTHPELLDWLAGELIRGGWRLKPMHKLIMTSATYRQTSHRPRPLAAGQSTADSENDLLRHQNVRRLEAEAIRDSLLAVSGALDPAMFGPGTLDEGHRRRSIYFTIKRSKLVPMMQLFDQPEPLVSIGSRPSTTIAPQALALVNSPHIRGYAHQFARRLLASYRQSPAAAVRQGYIAAVYRAPDAEDLAASVAFLAAQEKRYAGQQSATGNGENRSVTTGNPTELALADFCQVLFGLNEFVFVE
jgi:hypothetical protein